MGTDTNRADSATSVFELARAVFPEGGAPSRRRKSVKPFSTVIEVSVDPPDGHKFHMTISDSADLVQEGPHPKPDVVVSGPADAFLPVFSGDVSISQKIANGDVTFTGAYLSLMRLEKSILSSRRRS